MKYAYIGLKMTGPDSKQNGLFQIGILIEQDGKLVDKFYCQFRHDDSLLIDENFIKMYEKNEIDMDTILNEKTTEKEAYEKTVNFLSKYINRFDGKDRLYFVSYNIASAFAFYKEFCNRHSDNFLKYFWSNPIDLMTLAGELLKEERKSFEDFGFKTILGLFQQLNLVEKEISIDKNTAVWDAAMMYKMYKKVRFENLDDTVNFLNANS